jgi:hypothetical protein
MHDFLCIYFFNKFFNMYPWGHKLTFAYFIFLQTNLLLESYKEQ